MRLLIADIEPIIICGVVDLAILNYIVGIDEIAGLKVSFGLGRSWRAECQRPVFNGPTERLPEAVIGDLH